MVRFIYACCVLHNLANEDDLNNFEPPGDDNVPDSGALSILLFENDDVTDNLAGKYLRDEICRKLATHH